VSPLAADSIKGLVPSLSVMSMEAPCCRRRRTPSEFFFCVARSSGVSSSLGVVWEVEKSKNINQGAARGCGRTLAFAVAVGVDNGAGYPHPVCGVDVDAVKV